MTEQDIHIFSSVKRCINETTDLEILLNQYIFTVGETWGV